MAHHITRRSNHTCAYTVTVKTQWEPLCASASWNAECHSVLLHWLSGEETKCHFVPPQHSSTNRHRRTPVSLHSLLTLPRSPLTRPLPHTPHVLHSSTHLHSCELSPHLLVFFSPKGCACTSERQLISYRYENMKRCLPCHCPCTATHTQNWAHTASDTWLQVMP